MIVDILCSSIPVEDCFATKAARSAEQVGYARHAARSDELDELPDEFEPPKNRRELLEVAEARRREARARCPSPEEFGKLLDDAGIDVAVVSGHGDPLNETGPFTDPGGTVPKLVADFCATDPSRYVGMCWVDPFDADSAEQVDNLFEMGIGVVGVGQTCMTRGLIATDPRLGRIFGRCEKLGLPVSVGSAINWYTRVPYDLYHPRYIDAIATAFPDLKIIAAHAGWPWIMDMVMVAWRHQNVYIDLSTRHAKQFTNPAQGWDALLYYGDNVLADRVLFGSQQIGGDSLSRLGELVQAVRDLPLRQATIDKWLGLNGAALLNRG
jgi:predicted TIM-barrel fold metal-dependent hydrolase